MQSLGASAEKQAFKLSDEEIAAITADLAHDLAKRICDTAEMGDITTLIAISAEIKTDSEFCVPLSKQMV